MANILSVKQSDGNTSLPKTERNTVSQPDLRLELQYTQDEGGSGIKEFVIRNETSNNYAKNIVITSPQSPQDISSGSVLDQKWDYRPINGDDWRSIWQDSIVIPAIPPGQFIRVRTRVNTPAAGENTEPTTHTGSIQIDYLRSSVTNEIIS